MPEEAININPNAAKTVESLRHTGYNNYSAIMDIVDNSIDAKAKNIYIDIQSKGDDHQIIIGDDGCGMSKQSLQEAIKLGSNGSRCKTDYRDTLGKFGFGLCTASWSLAKKLQVYSKTKEGQLYIATLDVDDIYQQNKWIAKVKKVDPSDNNPIETLNPQNRFEKYTNGSSSGTVVVLTKVDNLKNRNTSSFKTTLTTKISRVYCKLMEKKKVNIHTVIDRKTGDKDVAIPAYDPLQWSNSHTKHVYEYDIPINVDSKQDKFCGNVFIRLAILPPQKAKRGRKKGESRKLLTSEEQDDQTYSLQNQGFYIYRNDREIVKSQKGFGSPYTVKHGDWNRFRGSIEFSSDLDAQVGINFQKDGVDIHRQIKETIWAAIKDTMLRIRNELKVVDEATQNEQLEQASKDCSKQIKKASKFLDSEDLLPEAEIEKRNQGNSKTITVRTSTGLEFTRTPRVGQCGTINGVKFITAHWNQGGQLLDSRIDKAVLEITLNVDHPYIEGLIKNGKCDNTELLELFMMLCIAKHNAVTDIEEIAATEYVQNLGNLLRRFHCLD